MLHGLPTILTAPQQQTPGPLGRPHRQLIHRQTLAPGLQDARARRRREAQRRHGELGHGEQAGIVGDGADDDEGAGRVGRVGGVSGEFGEGEGGAVDSGHVETVEEDAVEVAVGAACGLHEGCQLGLFLRQGGEEGASESAGGYVHVLFMSESCVVKRKRVGGWMCAIGQDGGVGGGRERESVRARNLYSFTSNFR